MQAIKIRNTLGDEGSARRFLASPTAEKKENIEIGQIFNK